MATKKLLKFKTRTWYYNRLLPAVGGGFGQSWVSPGDVVEADNVVYGDTDSYEGYIVGGHADLVEEQVKSPIASTNGAAKEV